MLAYAALILHHLWRAHWDPSVFVVAGDKMVDRAALLAPIAVLPNSDGYDGEYYYRLALNPFTTKRTDYGITIDYPPFRMQRIGYPLLAWIVSAGGRPALLSWVLIGLNLIGVGVITAVSTNLALRAAREPWLGLLPSLYPGFLLTILRDTTEIVAAAFAIVAVYFALNRSLWRAAPFWAAAVLTRETTLLYLFGFLVVAVFQMIKARHRPWDIVPIIIPVVIFCAWQCVLFFRWGAFPVHSGAAHDIGVPFVGIYQFLMINLSGHSLGPYAYIFLAAIFGGLSVLTLGHVVFKWKCPASLIVAWSVYAVLIQTLLRSLNFDSALHGYFITAFLFCAFIVGIVGYTALNDREIPVPLIVTWAAYTLLLVCLSASVWSQPYDFLRAFSDCYVTGMILIILTWRPSTRIASLAVGVMLPPTIFYGSVA